VKINARRVNRLYRLSILRRIRSWKFSTISPLCERKLLETRLMFVYRSAHAITRCRLILSETPLFIFTLLSLRESSRRARRAINALSLRDNLRGASRKMRGSHLVSVIAIACAHRRTRAISPSLPPASARLPPPLEEWPLDRSHRGKNSMPEIGRGGRGGKFAAAAAAAALPLI